MKGMENLIFKIKEYSIQITLSLGLLLLAYALLPSSSPPKHLQKQSHSGTYSEENLNQMRAAYTGSWKNGSYRTEQPGSVQQAKKVVKSALKKNKKNKKKKKKKVVKRTAKNTFSVNVVEENIENYKKDTNFQSHSPRYGGYISSKNDEDTSKIKTFEEWIKIIEKFRNKEIINDLVLSYEARITEVETFFAVVDYLLNSDNMEFKRMGVIALNLTPGDKSFSKMVLFIEKEPINSRASQDAKAYLKSYSRTDYIAMLNRLLFSASSSIQIQSALRLKEIAGNFTPATSNPSRDTQPSLRGRTSSKSGASAKDLALFTQSLSYLQSLLPSLADPSVSPYFQSAVDTLEKLLNS